MEKENLILNGKPIDEFILITKGTILKQHNLDLRFWTSRVEDTLSSYIDVLSDLAEENQKGGRNEN